MNKQEKLFPDSKNVFRVIYFGSKKEMHVEFNSHAVYVYKDVPKSKWEAATKAESIGKFINAEIKGKYSFEKK